MKLKESEFCKHKFRHQETKKRLATEGRRTRYSRTDIYICDICEESREISLSKLSKEKPDWY